MKRGITVAGLAVVLLIGWRMGAMQQEGASNANMISLLVKRNASDAEPTQEFKLEKDHALLSVTINDVYESLAGDEGFNEAIPLRNVTKAEVGALLNGENYDYILNVHRAYNEANPLTIKSLSDKVRRQRVKNKALALDPTAYQFDANVVKEALNDLKAAIYLNIPELIEKYACIIAMMLSSDASMRLLQANDQAHAKMISELSKNRTFADLIKEYISGEIWVVEHTLPAHTNGVHSASFSPDGSRIVTASRRDKTAKIWNASTGALERTLAGHTSTFFSASFSPDGSKIVTACADGRAMIWTVKIWNANTGALERTLAGHADLVFSASFSPDGSKIVTASRDETAKIWNASTGALERTLAGHNKWLESASFSPDGNKIVTASRDATAKIWNANTGAELRTLARHPAGLYSASFSPDGSKIVTASFTIAKIWNASTGALELAGHAGSVLSASFSPDGSKIVTASYDETAKIWNASTGALEHTLAAHTNAVGSASFSPDGSKIVTASLDSTAKIWVHPPVHTIEQALLLRYLEFIKNQGGRGGWESGWGRTVMDTYSPEEKALIKNTYPKEEKTFTQKAGSYLGFGSSSSSNDNN